MLTELITGLNPSVGQIAGFFTAWRKMPTPILSVLVKSMDEEMLKKIATWTETFAKHLNDLGPDAIDQDVLAKSIEYGDETEFFDVMNATKYIGPKLNEKNLREASNAATKAIKAQNWQDAVMVGMTLARMLPV